MYSVLPDTKICTKCGEAVALKKFYEAWDGKYGRASMCIKCVSDYNKERYRLKKLKAANG